MLTDLAQLRNKLEQFDSVGTDAPSLTNLVQAAVLVPIVIEAGAEGSWSLVFTKRTEDLPSHPGEISFPGGSLDPGEDSLQAALREADEEMGIEPTRVDVLGRLSTAFTRASPYLIDPWVGVIKDIEFRPNPDEIAEVIILPVRVFGEPGVKREQRFIRAGEIMSNPAYDVGANTIWGATARILSDLLELLD